MGTISKGRSLELFYLWLIVRCGVCVVVLAKYSVLISHSYTHNKFSVKVNQLHAAVGMNETEWQQLFSVNDKSRILGEVEQIGNYVAVEKFIVSESYI
jgi:hypothetical protein